MLSASGTETPQSTKLVTMTASCWLSPLKAGASRPPETATTSAVTTGSSHTAVIWSMRCS